MKEKAKTHGDEWIPWNHSCGKCTSFNEQHISPQTRKQKLKFVEGLQFYYHTVWLFFTVFLLPFENKTVNKEPYNKCSNCSYFAEAIPIYLKLNRVKNKAFFQPQQKERGLDNRDQHILNPDV